MKKFRIILAVALVAVMLGSLLTCFAAESEEEYVFVNIYDGKAVAAAIEKIV